MDEELLRDGMRTAVETEPPLGFDPDDVITEAGRKQRRRRAVLSVLLGTGALLAGVGALPGLLVDDDVTAASPEAGMSRPSHERQQRPDPAERGDAFASRLRAVVPQALANVTGVDVIPRLHDERRIELWVTVERRPPHIPVELWVEVSGPRVPSSAPSGFCAGPAPPGLVHCRTWPGRDGSFFAERISESAAPGVRGRKREVVHHRAGGHQVRVIADFVPGSDSLVHPGAHPTALTTHALERVAADPALSLGP